MMFLIDVFSEDVQNPLTLIGCPTDICPCTKDTSIIQVSGSQEKQISRSRQDVIAVLFETSRGIELVHSNLSLEELFARLCLLITFFMLLASICQIRNVHQTT